MHTQKLTSALMLLAALMLVVGLGSQVATAKPNAQARAAASAPAVTPSSVVYGLWGIFILAPFMRHTVEAFLKSPLGPLPVIRPRNNGPITVVEMLR